MEVKNIFKKSVLYFIGNLSSKILTSLLVPLYAFYIAATDLGKFDYNQTIMNIIIPIIFISVWESILRFVLNNNTEYTNEEIIATSAKFSIAISFAFIFIGYPILLILNVTEINFFIIMTIFTSLAQIWQFYSRALSRNNLYIGSGIIGTLVNLSLNIILICKFNLGLIALYCSYIISQLVIFLLIEIKLNIFKIAFKNKLNIKLLSRLLLYSSPLVINSIAAWLLNGFGRIIINNNIGDIANGLYSFANKFVNIISIVGSVVSMALLEESLKSMKDNKLDEGYYLTMQKLFTFFISVIMLSIPAISIFYSFISTTDYYSSIYLIPILMLYAVYLNMSINFGIIFKVIDKNRYQVSTTIFGSFFTIIISYALLNKFNIYAVIIGQLIGAIVMLASRYIICNKFISFKLSWYPIILQSIFYLVIANISVRCSIYLNIFIFIIILFYSIIINKAVLKEIIIKKNIN